MSLLFSGHKQLNPTHAGDPSHPACPCHKFRLLCCPFREQRIAAISSNPVDAGDKEAYLEQAPSLRMALGKLSLERKSLRAPGQEEDDADMHQVEMLLQAYFIQMDNTFNRLETMNEYISDTEVGFA